MITKNTAPQITPADSGLKLTKTSKDTFKISMSEILSATDFKG